MLVGLDRYLAATVLGAHPRPPHPHPPRTERDLSLTAPMPVGDPLRVVLALGATDLIDLLGHQFVHHTEPNTHAQREQALPRRPDQLPKRGLHPLRQRRRLHQRAIAHDLSSMYLLHGGSSSLVWT